MFELRFVRNDHQPDESYFYNFKEDALEHMNLFLDDDSNLYKKIELREQNDRVEKNIKVIDCDIPR